MELSGVISRWKEDFVARGGHRHGDHCVQEEDVEREQQAGRFTQALQDAHENEITLRGVTEQQRATVQQLEEALVVALGQISHVEEREGGLRELLVVLRRSEADLKQRAAVQVSRVKQVLFLSVLD